MDPEDQTVENSYRDVLAFYSAELQSHAGIVLSLALLIFAVIQTWGQLPESFRIDCNEVGSNIVVSWRVCFPSRAFAFSIAVGMLGAGILWQLLRLYVYGKLASAVLYSGGDVFKRSKQGFIKDHPKYVWDDFSDFLKITVYAQRISEISGKFLLGMKIFRRGKKGEGIQRRFWPLAGTFLLSFALGYGLIFWKFEGLVMVGYIVLLAIIIGIGRVAVNRIAKWRKLTGEWVWD